MHDYIFCCERGASVTDRRGGRMRGVHRDNSAPLRVLGHSLFRDEVRNEISLGSNLVNVMTTSSRSAITGLQCKDAKGGKTLTGSPPLIAGSPLRDPLNELRGVGGRWCVRDASFRLIS